MMNWTNVVENVLPTVVKIETRYGHGTGFLLYTPENANFYAIGTARHVIEHAAKWKESVFIHFSQEKKPYLYNEDNRIILFSPRKQDYAVLLIRKGGLNLLCNPISLLPSRVLLGAGEEVGWLGFPAGFGLCFFSGKVSARSTAIGTHDDEMYLIDGVAISGVSGGPLIFKDEKDEIKVAGLVTAYFPNRVSGEPFPGLSIAHTSKVLYTELKATLSGKLPGWLTEP